jgi:CRISPR/Cas system-associated exonuclease Cas4 (RecB family)
VIPITKKSLTKSQKKRWLSPSSINAYLRCPRNYYYSRIAKLKQKPSIYLIRGIAVHAAIHNFYKHRIHRCANMDYVDLRKIVIELLKDEWAGQKKEILELSLTQDEVAFYFEESRKMILNFLHDFLDDCGFEKPAPILEKTLFSKKRLLLGRLDAIYNNRDPPLLVDFKTCKSKELIDDYKRQLGIYALLYKENYNITPTVGIHFLKFRHGLENFKFTDSYISKISDLVQDIHNKTLSESIQDYPCVCGWCNKNFKFEGENEYEQNR